MTRKRRTLALLAGLSALALLLAGCAPAPGPAAGRLSPAGAPPESPMQGRMGDRAQNYTQGFTAAGEPFKGDPDAPVLFEEFSSYQCPYCARYFSESYPQVMADYVETGRVIYVFRDFPLPGQPQSMPAAETANCAGQVGGAGAFWDMHDLLLDRQSDWSGKGNARDTFRAYAGEIGLDTAAFGECLDSGTTRPLAEADVAEGGARGVRSTPTFLIDGHPLVGAQPYQVIAQAIDAALAGEPPPTDEPIALTPVAIAPPGDALTLGDPDAPVTIVEFSDYQCPFCAQHARETWPRLRTEYVDTGRVRYVFKDYPLTNLHPRAPRAHEAARCAGEQGAYYEMHDRLFAEQSMWADRSNLDAAFAEYAAELDLETSAFDKCVDSGRWADEVDADLAEGAGLGVRGTPTFFVDGYPLIGAQPYETFQYAIELAERGELGSAYEAAP